MWKGRVRYAALLLLDASMAAFAVSAALHLRFDGNVPSIYWSQLPTIIPLFVVVRIASLWAFRAYTSLWRYATLREALAGGAGVALGSVLLFTLAMTTSVIRLPRSVFAIEALLFAFAAGAPRFAVRWRRAWIQKASGQRGKRVLIVGAGDAGSMLVREFERQPHLGVHVVGLVDDDVTKINRELGGVRVLGRRRDIPDIVKRYGVERIIIAMPSAGADVIRETMAICRQTDAELKTLPPVGELVAGQVRAQDVRDVRIEDLLRREPVATDLTAISGYLRGKRVLVTGAGGSIGSELCRQVCAFEPELLVLLDHSENAVFEIDAELRERCPGAALAPVIADIRHRAKMDQVCRRYRPHVVFHAAAHKHVPLMEVNPDEAIANNVLGTRNVAEAAARWGAERFVMVSTDKAVNPGNVMGATKRMAELVVQAMQAAHNDAAANGAAADGPGPGRENGAAADGAAADGAVPGGTRFVSVRFGNVLGSRGSVIPMFQRQIEQGGPVTVTHPDMTRYFMTIPEAVQLILQAAAIGRGGEVFLLDMGEPVRIADLAHDLIRLSGLVPGKDIEIVYTGVRPGEKLFEELINDGETVIKTSHEKIMALAGREVDVAAVRDTVRRFEELLADEERDERKLAQLVDLLYAAVDGRPVNPPAAVAAGAAVATGAAPTRSPEPAEAAKPS